MFNLQRSAKEQTRRCSIIQPVSTQATSSEQLCQLCHVAPACHASSHALMPSRPQLAPELLAEAPQEAGAPPAQLVPQEAKVQGHVASPPHQALLRATSYAQGCYGHAGCTLYNTVPCCRSLADQAKPAVIQRMSVSRRQDAPSVEAPSAKSSFNGLIFKQSRRGDVLIVSRTLAARLAAPHTLHLDHLKLNDCCLIEGEEPGQTALSKVGRLHFNACPHKYTWHPPQAHQEELMIRTSYGKPINLE